MEDISIIESEHLQGIVVFYNPELIAKTGHKKTLTEYHKNHLPLFPIIDNILIPLLVETKGQQYANWIPVSLFIGQIVNGEYLPVLRLIEKPSINMLQIDSPEEQQIISRYIDSYIRQYMNLTVNDTGHTQDTADEEQGEYYMILFHNFSHMLDACLSASFQSCEQREVWKYKDVYYVIFDGDLKTVNQIANVLLEYDGYETDNGIIQEHIMEHGTCITADIMKLQKAFS